MNKVISKKARPLKHLNSQPHFLHLKNVRLKTATSSTQKREITNFYHQKKRTISNDSFEDSPNKLQFGKNHRKSDSEISIATVPDLPIGWQVDNKNIDCQLRIQCKIEINKPSKKDTSPLKKGELKVDQMLHEIFNKLQFGGQSKKEDDKDSGNEEGKESGNEFDELLDDSWAIKGMANEELNELERKLSQPVIDQSKESGVSSCCSIDLNKQNVSPIISNSQEDRTKTSDFKVPETPAKIKFNISNQFNSTPKILSRQASKLNQSLNFEGISPIKGDQNCLVNIKQESKRQLDESGCEENLSKKRAKVLFGQAAKRRQQVDDELMDDSFDVVLSQVDDKVLAATNQSQIKPNYQPQLKKSNSQPARPLNKQYTQCFQPLYKPINNSNRNSIHSNTPSSIQSRSSIQTTRSSTESSIQFTDDSSLFAREKIRLGINLNDVKQVSESSVNLNQAKPQTYQINIPSQKVKIQTDDDDLLADDLADFICSQVP